MSVMYAYIINSTKHSACYFGGDKETSHKLLTNFRQTSMQTVKTSLQTSETYLQTSETSLGEVSSDRAW